MPRPPIRCYPDLPQSLRLRDLAGMREDIKLALRYVEVVERQVAQNHRDLTIWEAVTSAAVVAYARCFNEGVRTWLPHQTLNSAPPEIQKEHDYLIALRNKHVAHSVNLYEDNRLWIDIALSNGQPTAICDADVECHRLIGISDPDLPAMRRLFEWLLSRLDDIYEEERRNLLRSIANLPVESLASQRLQPAPGFLQPDAHRKSRPRR